MPRQPIASTFGKLVRKHRQALKLSQEVLAEKAEVHPTYIGLLERGKRSPGLEVADRVAYALGMKLSQIIIEAESE